MAACEGFEELEVARILLSLNPGDTSDHQQMVDASGLLHAEVDGSQPAQSSKLPTHIQPLSCQTTSSPLVSRKLPTRLKVDWQSPPGRKLLSIVGKFSLIEAICCYDDLALYIFTQFVAPREMLKLYCVSKRFHWIANSHLTTYMLSSARRWAPLLYLSADATLPALPNTYAINDITTLMPFHNFLYLCTDDPTGQRTWSITHSVPIQSSRRKGTSKHSTTLERTAASFLHDTSTLVPNDSDTAANRGESAEVTEECHLSSKPRHVPTFRYLFFVTHRARIINSILRALYLHGHRLPRLTPAILAKVWLTLDLPTTALRQALFRNTRYWKDGDLRCLFIFCMKLDMLFSDPIDGKGETSLREMMLAQRTLTVVARVLARQECKTSLDMMKLYVRWKYKSRPEHLHAGYSILGIPANEVGCLEKEYWGERVGHEGLLMRPDECAMREARMRGMDVRKEVVKYLLWGYIDKRSLEDVHGTADFGAGVDGGSAPW